jgi:hypothetical protein
VKSVRNEERASQWPRGCLVVVVSAWVASVSLECGSSSFLFPLSLFIFSFFPFRSLSYGNPITGPSKACLPTGAAIPKTSPKAFPFYPIFLQVSVKK